MLMQKFGEWLVLVETAGSCILNFRCVAFVGFSKLLFEVLALLKFLRLKFDAV